MKRGQLIRDLLNKIVPHLPKSIGATLIIFDYTTTPGMMDYISTAEREDMKSALKELLNHWDHGNFGSN